MLAMSSVGIERTKGTLASKNINTANSRCPSNRREETRPQVLIAVAVAPLPRQASQSPRIQSFVQMRPQLNVELRLLSASQLTHKHCVCSVCVSILVEERQLRKNGRRDDAQKDAGLNVSFDCPLVRIDEEETEGRYIVRKVVYRCPPDASGGCPARGASGGKGPRVQSAESEYTTTRKPKSHLNA